MNNYSYPALLLVTALLLAACGEKVGEKSSQPLVVVRGVTVEPVNVVRIPETIEVTGTVQARNGAAVLARIPGSVSYLKVRAGDRVRKGQLLALLEAQESQSGAAAAKAATDDAAQGVAEALSRKKLTDATFERYQKLYQEQAITRQEFDIKQTEKELASQGAVRAEARLQQSLATSRSAAAVAGYAKVVAPISGVVTVKKAELGGTVFPGQPLFTIEDEGSYLLDLAIPESLAAKVTPGMGVELTLDSSAGKVRGKIAEIVPAVDPGSRTFSARVNLDQKGLKSGMFGRGEIALGSSVNGIFVPQKAVVEHGALQALWVVDKAGIARMRLVKLGKTVGGRSEVLSGLSAGETVAITGTEKLSEGAKVQ